MGNRTRILNSLIVLWPTRSTSSFILFFFTWIYAQEYPASPSSMRSPDCELRQGQGLLSVLPGVGWDNLVNEERGLTTDREVYTACRMSSDGKLLLPDDIIVEPLRSSRIELSSECFSHSTNYTSVTAYSMNTAVEVSHDLAAINGDFSFEKEAIRKAENLNNGLIVRSQLRHRIYAVHQLPDAKLHPRFRNRLLDIAAHLARSNITFLPLNPTVSPRSVDPIIDKDAKVVDPEDKQFTDLVNTMRAAYLADLVVRDYGTHTVTSVEAGAVVAKLDSLSSSSRKMSSGDQLKLSAGASASFSNFFKLSSSTKADVSDEANEKYQSLVSSSTVLSYGGPNLKASEMNLSLWEDGIIDNLVAIDRSGRPIYDLITPRTLPELSETMAFRLAAVIRQSVARYYTANSVVGCLDPNSPSYDMDANVASDQCDHISNSGEEITETKRLPFGGVFEVCNGPEDLCSGWGQANLATGQTSCPVGYAAVQLLPPQVRVCARTCDERSYFHQPECQHQCSVTTAYWCAIDITTINSTTPQDLGFLFGGIYTDTISNPITNTQSCPLYYEEMIVGRRLHICASMDREFGKRYAMRFGGFYACQSGNPLIDVFTENTDAEKNVKYQQRSNFKRSYRMELFDGAADMSIFTASLWPKRCPAGFTSHLAAIEDICQVNYCILANSLKTTVERKLKRPPFIHLSEFSNIRMGDEVSRILDEPLFLQNGHGRLFVNRDGIWEQVMQKPYSFNMGWVALPILLILFLTLLATIPIVYVKRRQRLNRRPTIICSDSSA